VLDNTLYVGSLDAKVYALNATTGAFKWSVPTGAIYVASSPAIVGGVVYVGAFNTTAGASKVLALNASTGATIWASTAGGAVSSSPAVANGVVYIGSMDGKLYALNASTGARLWSYTTGSSVQSSPALANGVVYVASMDGKLYALNASSGARLWSRALNGSVTSSPAVANGAVYVGGDRVYAFKPGADSDHDGLADAVETNTGTFTDSAHTGTDPGKADTDGDGINDGDEVFGTPAGVDLPAMGANPLHKDLFIEADWYSTSRNCSSTYSTRVTDYEYGRVRDSFAAAPITNPDGASGIHLVIDYGQGGAFAGGNLIAGDGNIAGDVNGTDFNTIKAANFSPKRQGYFHYALMASQYNGGNSSGVAELPGNDFIVSLPACYSLFAATNGASHDEQLANTIMHELGHNLGLHHGGSSDANNRPNFNSIMNYRYQGNGVDTTCHAIGDHALDYSHGAQLTLNESALNENVGVCGAGHPIDWVADGILQTSVASDLDGNGTLQTYSDFNDWSHVSLAGLTDADGARVAPHWVVEQPAFKR
jgi:hypothetical protein